DRTPLENPTLGPNEIVHSIFEGLNRARARARLAPVTLSAAQSSENTRLAGTLFEATRTNDHATADRIALGLMAGWEIGAMIRGGNVYVERAAPTRDPRVWLAVALEHPMGRSFLL